ncbi:MAG: hypothetical protein R2754_03160 [Microthrixaceae bacterium]
MPAPRLAPTRTRIGSTPAKAARLTSLAAVGLAAAVMAGACGGSGEMSQDDFVRVVSEADLEAAVEPDVLARYAECLYVATDGDVTEFVDHLGDADYQPSQDAEEALATCSDVLAG